MEYTVTTFRNAGLKAKWGRTSNGAPMLFVKHEAHRTWYAVDRGMWSDMQKEGIAEAYERHTMLGQFFSIPA